MRQYVFERSFGEHEAVFALSSAQPVGSEFYLARTFLARHVQRFQRRLMQGDLQTQRRFAYSGFAAHESNRPGYQTAAQQTIHFVIVQSDSVVLEGADVLYRFGFRMSTIGDFRKLSRRRFRNKLLDESVPFAANRTLTQPLG